MTTTDRPCVFLLFGARGDLAARKLFPGLYRLASAGRLPTSYAVIGSGRHSPGSDDDFRSEVLDGLRGTAAVMVVPMPESTSSPRPVS